MGFHNKVWSILFLFLILHETCSIRASDLTHSQGSTSLSGETVGRSSHQNSYSILTKNDKGGHVIFNDNLAFGANSAVAPDNRNKRDFSGPDVGGKQRQDYSSNAVAGGYLKNHRLEQPLVPEVTLSSTAAGGGLAAISSNYIHNENDLKHASDNSQLLHGANAGAIVGEAGAGLSGLGGQGRAYHVPVPSQYQSHGWASNSGSCLFSCSTGSLGGASCCQQNYIQCCPNPQHEQWNFKNLHHGRGYLGGGGGNFKGGYGWGSIPYYPSPIVGPNPCPPHLHHHVPHPGPIGIHAGGTILNKGIETIKHNIHNIGQFFKDQVSHGHGWTSGGNGAGGAYFHRRSDDETQSEIEHYGINSSKKRRPTRSVNNQWDRGGFGQMVACPVYSIPPTANLGWHVARPYSTGLGSLVGWTKPGHRGNNYIHTGYLGGGHGNLYDQYGITSGRYGNGWSSGSCQWDYQCQGSLRCCKGTCQVAPYTG